MTWKNYSRTCARCGNVGPRVSNPTGPGWIHAYCRTEEEKRAERQRLTEQARQLAARIAAHKAGVAATPASECQHPKAKCVYDSDDGEFERWQCPDCGKRWGVEIPQ
jgi:hypothetical protein